MPNRHIVDLRLWPRLDESALDFEVSREVLVPNPDTEVLVQRAVAIAREAGTPIRAADVGTGSGCIAVALAHYAPNVEVWAGDVSERALEVAGRNVATPGSELLSAEPGSPRARSNVATSISTRAPA